MREKIVNFIAACQTVLDERLGKGIEILKAEEYEHHVRVVRHVDSGEKTKDNKPIIKKWVYCHIDKNSGSVLQPGWHFLKQDRQRRRFSIKLATVGNVTDKASDFMGVTGPLHRRKEYVCP